MEKVQLFVTCMGENLLPDVVRKMVILLERLGVECGFPEGQTCCGQPFFNSGFQTEGREMALRWMRAFADTEGYIVAPSGSCIEFVKHRYPKMFPEGSAEQSAQTLEPALGRPCQAEPAAASGLRSSPDTADACP